MSNSISTSRSQDRSLLVDTAAHAPEVSKKTDAAASAKLTSEASEDGFTRGKGANDAGRFVSARAITAESSLAKNRAALEALASELQLPGVLPTTNLPPDAVTAIVARAVEQGAESLLEDPAFWTGLTLDLSLVPAEEASAGYAFESGTLGQMVDVAVSRATKQIDGAAKTAAELSPPDVVPQDSERTPPESENPTPPSGESVFGFESTELGHEKQTINKKQWDVTQNVVTGRWAETFQGERANRNAGAGINDESNVAGSGKDHVSSDTTDGTKEPSAGAQLWDALFGWGNQDRATKGASMLEIFMGDGRAKGDPLYNKPWPHRPGGHGSRGSERPDEDRATDVAPMPLGQERDPIKASGLAGGTGDGRGELDAPDQGGGLLVDKAVMTEIMKDGREIKDRATGKLSMEEALKQAQWTDPVES